MGSRVNKVDLASLNRGGQLLGMQERERSRSRSPSPQKAPPQGPPVSPAELRAVCNSLEAKIAKSPIKIPPQISALISLVKDLPDDDGIPRRMKELSVAFKLQQLKAATEYLNGINELCARLYD